MKINTVYYKVFCEEYCIHLEKLVNDWLEGNQDKCQIAGFRINIIKANFSVKGRMTYQSLWYEFVKANGKDI